MTRALVADEKDAGLRLDAFVARETRNSTRLVRTFIAAGDVRVNGRRAVKGLRLQSGDRVEVAQTGASAVETIEPSFAVPVVVLYEDDDLVAIDKPVGMPSHPLRQGEGTSAAAILVGRFPACATAADSPREAGLGHRLDRGTGGVLIAAKHAGVWKDLRRALSGGKATKTYLAEVVGVPPPRQVINMPIGHGGPRGSTARVGFGRGMLPAETIVEAVALRQQTALVRATISAGRQHQVRAHLAHLGLPILGDERYGSDVSWLLSASMHVSVPRLFAESVTLDHPRTQERIRITAPKPSWAE